MAEGLLEALAGEPLEGRRVLVARAAEARTCCPTPLRERGAEVELLALYDTVAEPLAECQRESLERATHVTFTSSSTVGFFLDGGGGVPARARGVDRPVTSATLRERGIEVHVEAQATTWTA